MRFSRSGFPSTSTIVALGACLVLAGVRPASAGQASNPHATHGSPASASPNPAGGPTTANAIATALPIAVDGSKTPENIPDHIAYHHFIMAVAKPAHASALQLAKRNAWLARVGLSQHDLDQLETALSNVPEALDRVARDRKRASPRSRAGAAALAKLKAQEKDILDGARWQLQGSLSWEGAARVDKHIQEHVKRHIVIYGEPPQQ
jgi:hypothetical protein